ncbi:MAG: hypothetical protein R3B53_02420 [Candidatus Paceibacterota bacterium]
MKNFFLISSIVAVAVGAGALYLLVSDGSKGSSSDNFTPQETSSTEVKPVASPTSGNDTLRSLLSRAEDLECTIAYTNETSGQAVEGTYFTSQGKMRGDFIVPGPSGEMVSSMIMRDQTMYSWTEIEGETYGMKIDLATMESQKTTGTGPDTREPVPLDEAVNYSCKAWENVDGSILKHQVMCSLKIMLTS